MNVPLNDRDLDVRNPLGLPAGADPVRAAPADDLDPSWEQTSPRDAPPLAPGEVHVWIVPGPHGTVAADDRRPQRPPFQVLLDAEERKRAAAFVFERDRTHFIAAHVAVRTILAAYAGASGAALRFGRDPGGKPHLLQPQTADPPLVFNMSHSAGWTLLGVTRVGAIGVDLEPERDIANMEAIARDNFAPAEVEELRQLAPARRRAGFFACWTRKEAFVKALGVGLSGGLATFEVTVDPERPALLAVSGCRSAAESYSLFGWQPLPGLHAAAVVRGRLSRLRRLRCERD